MIESLLDLWEQVNSILKRLGKGEMCLDSDDRDLLKELKQFMKPFKEYAAFQSCKFQSFYGTSNTNKN